MNEVKKEVFVGMEDVYNPETKQFVYPVNMDQLTLFIGSLSSVKKLVFDPKNAFDGYFLRDFERYLGALKLIITNKTQLLGMSKNLEISVTSTGAVHAKDVLIFVTATRVVDGIRRYQVSQSQVKIDELEMQINKLKAQIPGQQGYSK